MTVAVPIRVPVGVNPVDGWGGWRRRREVVGQLGKGFAELLVQERAIVLWSERGQGQLTLMKDSIGGDKFDVR